MVKIEDPEVANQMIDERIVIGANIHSFTL